MKTYILYKQIGMNMQYGRKWFFWQTKVLPIVAIIYGINDVKILFEYFYIFTSNILLFLSFVASMLNVVLQVMFMKKANGQYDEFVKFVKEAMFYQMIAFSYTYSIGYYFQYGYGAVLISVLLTVLVSALYYQINIFYFEKRLLCPTLVTALDFYEENSIQIEESTSYTEKDCELVSNDEILLEESRENYKEENSVMEEKELTQDKTARGLFCRKCGTNLAEDSVYCNMCGTKVIEESLFIICKKCGQKLTNDSLFCQYCGNEIEK